MSGSLDGRTAIVTGAGRGIGAAIAVALDAAGARVALVARSAEQLDEVALRLTNKPIVVPADLATADAPSSAVATAIAAFDGRVDVLVNNAGMAIRKESDQLVVAELDTLWNTNVRSALLATIAVLPAMLAAGSGSVVSISSISGLRGAPRRAMYAASKSALDGMTRALAMEYGPRGLRFNAVAPGVVDTAMWRAALEAPEVTDAVLGVIPTRRVSTPEEVADTVVFLASDASRAITGEVLSADGGMHATINLWPTV